MSATLITAEDIPHDSSGYNVTDSADFSTLSTGSGNGVKFAWEEELLVVLKNDTGGAAVFTLIPRTIPPYTQYGATVANTTISVATGKTYVMRLDDPPLKNSSEQITIECDVAGKCLVLRP